MCSVFRESKKRVGRADRGVWGYRTRKLMLDLGLERQWETLEVGKLSCWKRKVWQSIQLRESLVWRKGMIGKVTLDRYRRIKTELRRERFLKRNIWRAIAIGLE